jgi:putative protease
VFSRGFTTAYLTGERGNEMMSYRRPNNRGTLIGRVAAIRDGLVEVQTNASLASLASGDILEFRTSRGQATVRLEDFSFSSADKRLRLCVPAPVGRGDRVFRVRNTAVLEEAGETYGKAVFAGNRGLVTVDAQVCLRLGEPVMLALSLAGDTRGQEACRVQVMGPVLEEARSKPLTEADVREHIGRVGTTPFSIKNWDIELDEGLGLGFSVLHRLRAEALEALTERILRPWRTRREIPPSAQASLPALAPARRGTPRVAALVSDERAAKVARKAGADLVYLNPWPAALGVPDAVGAISATAGEGRGNGRGNGRGDGSKTLSGCFLPAISHDRDLSVLFAQSGFCSPSHQRQRLVVNNLAELSLAQQAGASFEAGGALGICNQDALGLLAREGAVQAWLSPELSRSDISSLASAAPLPLAIIVSGRAELMVTEHCLLMAKGPCDQQCAHCPRRKSEYLLEDRKGYRFPVRTDCFGRSHLYNAIALDLIPSFPELLAAGISTFVVDGTLMNTATLKAETERARRALNLALTNGATLSKQENRTTGHLYRGVQ